MLTFDREKTSHSHDLFLFDADGKRIKSIASYPYPYYGRVDRMVLGAFNAYRPYISLIQLNDSYVVYGFSSTYRLSKVSFKGKVDLIIEKEEAPEAISKQERESNIESEIGHLARRLKIKLAKKDVFRAYNFPKYKPFFMGLHSNSLENIYVMKYWKASDFDKKLKQVNYDLFNHEGLYTYRLTSPKYLIHVIKHGFLYTQEIDKETGFIQVKKYKIKNWEKIKSSANIKADDLGSRQ